MTGRRLAPLGLLPAFVLVVAWLLVPTAVAGGGPCHHEIDPLSHQDEATTEIKLAPCAFSPTVARIPVGGTVTFFNGESAHLITGANQLWGDRDTEIQPHARVSFAFDKAGIYPYACVLHPGMSGAIVVGDVGQAGAGAAPLVADAPAPPAAPSASTATPAALAAIAGSVGIVVGAGIALLVMTNRRRRASAIPGVATADATTTS